jgi:hypothetical protein
MMFGSTRFLEEASGLLSVIGFILQLAYRLRRHFVGAWSLARWLGIILVLACMAVLIAQRSFTWIVILLAAVLLVYVGMLIWAGQKRYVYFSASPAAESLLRRVPPAPPLEPEELVPVRAGGSFNVHGQEQHYMNLEAKYESVRSREHIVLARVTPSRFLWLGGWPDDEIGHWYVFFQPDMIQRIRAGYLHFGSEPWLAIEIVYAPDDESRQSVYLASEDVLLRRIWDDLARDAPSEANGWAGGDVD